MIEEVKHETGDARKTESALTSLLKRRDISREAKVSMYEGTVETALLSGCEMWVLNV